MDPAVRIARVPRRPPPSDLALAGALAVWALLEAFLADGPGPLAARVAFALAVSVPLVFRRRLPLAVIGIVVVATALRAFTTDVPETGATPFPETLVATFSVALYARTEAGALVGLAAALGWEFLIAADLFAEDQTATDYAILTFFVLGAWTAGWLVGRRADQVRRAMDQSGELAREAVMTERARIARELHDVVAHSVSIIAVQAGAADELVERDPKRAREHLDTVRRTAREAMVEMRHLLDVLREDEASYAPQPTLERLEELVEEVRASGVPVELVEEGDRPVVPAGIDLAAYRMVQEALTNVRKHAGPVATRVVVRYADGHIELEVGTRRDRPGTARAAATGWWGSASGRAFTAAASSRVQTRTAASWFGHGCRWRRPGDQGAARGRPRARAGRAERHARGPGGPGGGGRSLRRRRGRGGGHPPAPGRGPHGHSHAATRRDRGYPATQRARGRPRVVVLTTFDLDEYVYEALRAGAAGFLLKDAPPSQIAEAVRTVAAGDQPLAPAVTERLVERFVTRPPPDAARREQFEQLTERELEVLRHVARGLSNAEIGEQLFLSEATVKTHLTRILSKLGLRDRVQAVVLAYESGLIEPGGSSSPG